MLESTNTKNANLPSVKIGTDICQTNRIKKVYEKYGERFLNRVLTKNEKQYVISNQRQLINRLSGRFAAKEAVSKVLETGFKGVYFKEIEITRDPSGKPNILLHQRAQKIAEDKKLFNFEVSISHDHDFAIAFVVAVKK